MELVFIVWLDVSSDISNHRTSKVMLIYRCLLRKDEAISIIFIVDVLRMQVDSRFVTSQT